MFNNKHFLLTTIFIFAMFRKFTESFRYIPRLRCNVKRPIPKLAVTSHLSSIRNFKQHIIYQKVSPLKGVIDDEAIPLLSGSLSSFDIYNDQNNVIYDVGLIRVDISMNTDKYYILQLIEDTTVVPDPSYYFFTRWGRTGTKGQFKLDGPVSFTEAMKLFECKFLEKTGNKWSDHNNFQLKANKYTMINIDHAQKLIDSKSLFPAKWEYYVDDFVDGKSTGWYEYTKDGIKNVEDLWVVYQNNNPLFKRIVESGKYEYLVDLVRMTQTNINAGTSKVRLIRRTLNGVITCATTAVNLSVPLNANVNNANTVSTSIPISAAIISPANGVGVSFNSVQSSTFSNSSIPAPTNTTTAQSIQTTTTTTTNFSRPVDKHCYKYYKGAPIVVVDDYDCTLNQVNLEGNANKFYRLQLLEEYGNFVLWMRWGRVGEIGKGESKTFCSKSEGVDSFKAKFKEKTGNRWDDIDKFKSKAKKYDLIIMKNDVVVAAATASSSGGTIPPSKLAPQTQNLISLILDKNMFKVAMQSMNLDLQRMPLGALSAAQVQKGYDILEQMKTMLLNGSAVDSQNNLVQLSGAFYTSIPHSFPRSRRPPLIDSIDELNSKFELLSVLEDIAVAQGMLATSTALDGLSENPMDAKYREFNANLDLLTQGPVFDGILKYISSTKGQYSIDVENIWAVRRGPEDSSFNEFNSVSNHRLLWHGTNIAVVAAILKAGLRIMPSVNGGRVGRGIYFANELSKSADYVRTTTDESGRRIGVLFLVEAALGNMKVIHDDDSSLTKAPEGFDSVLAQGSQSPDPQYDLSIPMDGVMVAMSQSHPVTNHNTRSSFRNDEYLVYKESQQRLRFILTFKY